MKIWIRLHRIFHHKAIVLLSESERLMLIKSLLTAAAPEGLQKHEIFNFKHNTLRPSTILLYSLHGHWTNLLFFLSIRLIWTLWFWSQKTVLKQTLHTGDYVYENNFSFLLFIRYFIKGQVLKNYSSNK